MRLLLLLALLSPAGAYEIVPDPTGGRVGDGFINRFRVPTEKEAAAKLSRLRAAKRSVSVEEFLGGAIKSVRVTWTAKGMGFEDARSLVRGVLAAEIVGPAAVDSPSLFPDWAEQDRASVRAIVVFQGGSTGRIETDGAHVFLQDEDGTFWWRRLPASVKPAP